VVLDQVVSMAFMQGKESQHLDQWDFVLIFDIHGQFHKFIKGFVREVIDKVLVEMVSNPVT